VLSYAYSRARIVQGILAAGTDLACTQATGIVALCGAAAETWRRVESQPGSGMTQLAALSIQQLVITQVTALLAGTGKGRWCELAMASPGAAASFLAVFPGTGFVCVHRSCPDVIREGIQASPWGLQDPAVRFYCQPYPGNNVAALAAYWADATETLLAFEAANPQSSHRIRYEDVESDPDHTLTQVRTSLRLNQAGHGGQATAPAEPKDAGNPGFVRLGITVPAEMIPRELRRRIDSLHAQLGYSPSFGQDGR
jgi:hypothetical protein